MRIVEFISVQIYQITANAGLVPDPSIFPTFATNNFYFKQDVRIMRIQISVKSSPKTSNRRDACSRSNASKKGVPATKGAPGTVGTRENADPRKGREKGHQQQQEHPYQQGRNQQQQKKGS
jgi:hypothetical protein